MIRAGIAWCNGIRALYREQQPSAWYWPEEVMLLSSCVLPEDRLVAYRLILRPKRPIRL